LKAVLSQLLLPRKDGKGRVAAFELMINTPSIASLIRDNKSFRIPTDIQTGSKYGMVWLEAALVDLFHRGIISLEEVMTKAQDPDAVKQLLAGKPSDQN
jgi:twitching motility protein PilT